MSEKNPYGADRYGFLWEVLQQHPTHRHLDYGAYDGSVICTLVGTGCAASAVGVEVNHVVVEQHQPQMPEGVELHRIERGQSLPFDNGSFDSASMLDVLEHIADQEAVLEEINRVLKPGGVLVVTVPGKHLFSFLDTGNFKFRFPRLHRRLYLLRHTESEYHRRYVDNPDGLIGDIEREKGWHQHFTRAELSNLLESCGFQNREFDGSGFFTRLILPLWFVSPGVLRRSWERVLNLDARIFNRTNLFCRAEKAAGSLESRVE